VGPPDSNGVSRVPFYLGSRWEVSEFRARAFHPLWGTFPGSCTILQHIPYRGPATPSPRQWFGLLPVRSPLLGESRLFSFPPVTEMFHFAGFRSSHPIDSGAGNLVFSQTGFSHSDISGSQPICGSPKLFAAYHVLLRHSMPGHSPCALSNLTKLKSRFLSRCFICIPYLCNFQRTVDCLALAGLSFQNHIQQDVSNAVLGDVVLVCQYTLISQPHNTSSNWWAHQDSNLGPRPYQGRALTN